MFTKLPSLLGRDFVIAHVLPMVAFVAAVLAVLEAFGHAELRAALQADILSEVSVLLLGVWIAATLLLLLNHDIVRFFEGYGRWNPWQLFSPVERRRLRALGDEIEDLRRRGETGTERFMQLRQRMAVRFPHDESLLLPTALGNTIRAFEAYPTVLYGMDAIHAWPRLIGLVPEHMRDAIDDARTRMDAWLNVLVLSVLFLPAFAAAVLAGTPDGSGPSAWSSAWSPAWWLAPAGAVGLALVAYERAVSAAAGWGLWVKAVFDLYQDDLARALDHTLPEDPDRRRLYWTQVSQAMIYRHAASLDRAARTAAPAATPPPREDGG
jgi:hypothetical protein